MTAHPINTNDELGGSSAAQKKATQRAKDRARYRRWAAANPEKVKAKNKRRKYQARPLNRQIHDRVYYARHRDEILTRRRAAAEKPNKAGKPVIVLGVEYGRLVDSFLRAKGLRAPATIRTLKTILHLFGQYLGDVWPVTEDEINGFLAEGHSRGLSDSTVWNYYRALRTFFCWLHKRGRIETNPILLAERPPKPRLLPRAPKEQDVKRLLDYLATEARSGEWVAIRNQALIVLALDSGMRRGELAALKVSDLDLAHRTATIFANKTKASRVCALTPFCCEILSNWLTIREQIAGAGDVEEVFLSQHGGGLTPTGIFRVLEAALARAGVNRFGVHSLRHAYAIYSLRNGAVLTDIQKQLGHSSVATTSRYLMVDDAGRIERHAATSPLSYLGGPPA